MPVTMEEWYQLWWLVARVWPSYEHRNTHVYFVQVYGYLAN